MKITKKSPVHLDPFMIFPGTDEVLLSSSELSVSNLQSDGSQFGESEIHLSD